MYTSEVIINNRKLHPIRKVFDSWININIEYSERYQYTDCLFWYNERSNVGALAGAIWRIGGVALEEYSSEKQVNTDDRVYQGRRDLYFEYNSNRYLCEAKIKWLKCSKNDTKSLSEINYELAKARTDTENSLRGGTGAEAGLAIVFVVPYCPTESNAGQSAILESITQNTDYDLVAYLKYEQVNIKSDKNSYNQIILVADYIEK